MLCSEIMRRVASLTPQDSCKLAARRMRDLGVGLLPVCDPSGVVLGVLSARGIAIRVVAEGRAANVFVSDIMARELAPCRPTDDVERARELIRLSEQGGVLCTDDAGRICGVICVEDLGAIGDCRPRAGQPCSPASTPGGPECDVRTS